MLLSLRSRIHETFVRWALRVRPPEPAPIILVQRRVYVLPTRAGLAYAMALGVILLGAMNYNLSLGHALVFLLTGLGLVGILHTFRNLVMLSIKPGRSAPVFAGETAQFDLVLGNQRADARTCLRLFIADEDPIEIDIGPSASTIATVGTAAKKRGWLPLPRVTIETTWPLGLVRAWSYVVPELNCLVYPKPSSVAPPLPWHGESARGTSKDGRGKDDFSGLRSHQISDPPRHVAWKAVARQQDGPLLTKLFSGAAAQELWLDWDTLPDTIDLEQRLSILTRWMLDADSAGLAWGLRTPSIRLNPDNGPAQLATGLRALALYGNGAQ
ncbi:MAG: DUF58 domain-containing protein [Sulfuritalea sp.]|nr:DUF58 domain-containing protein [Sulfuritalea sp.]